MAKQQLIIIALTCFLSFNLSLCNGKAIDSKQSPESPPAVNEIQREDGGVPVPPTVPGDLPVPEATVHPKVECPPRAAASYCKNGGHCQTPAEHGGYSGIYICYCKEGYYGRRCENRSSVITPA